MPWPQSDGSLAYIAASACGLSLAWWLVRAFSRPAPSIGTGFDDFLKHRVDNPRLRGAEPAEEKKKLACLTTSFEAYLKADVGAAGGPSSVSKTDGTAAAAAETSPPDTLSSNAIPVLVLFGTEYGFSREVAETACTALRGLGLWPLLSDMATFSSGLPSLAAHQAILVACSTQGDGGPPAEARSFCGWLSGAGAPRLDGVAFSVCAMGDRSYAHFCRCGRGLDARLEAMGANRAFPRADIDKEDWAAVRAWVAGATAALGALPLKTAAELGGSLGDALKTQDGKKELEAKTTVRKSRPCVGTVVAVTGLCKVESEDDKNTGERGGDWNRPGRREERKMAAF
jgi:sulfite reductase alpha subunit-like flavoprotein